MSALCASDAAYVLGALSPVDRHEYEEHLRACATCQASVQRIAGLPGLLALTTAEALEGSDPQVPQTLLPSLIERVHADRRRRAWTVGGLLAASLAAVLALAVTLAVRPTAETAEGYPQGGGSTASSTPSAPPAAGTAQVVEEQLVPVGPGPMTASLELADKKWGTAITVVCAYGDDVDSSVAYDLTVIDTAGQSDPAGTWRAVPGATMRVNTATSLSRNRIAAFEVRLPDGRAILRSSS